MATQLGLALREAGHDILAVYSRTMGSAETLTSLIGGFPTNSPDLLPNEADAYLVSVKDSALQELIPQVTKGRADQLFLHTAGSMPMNVFEGYASRYGVFYPMQTSRRNGRLTLLRYLSL